MTVIIGIDPHKASHTAVAIDTDEKILDTVRLSSSKDQVAQLRDWACRFDSPLWAIESAQGLGYLLSRQLIALDEPVVDVPPVLSSRTRLLASGRTQKNDPNDAYSVAVAALRNPGLRRVTTNSHVEVLKLMAKRHRDIGRLRNQSMSRLHALLLDLAPGGVASPMRLSAARTLALGIEHGNGIVEHRRELCLELIDDIERFEKQIARSKRRLREAVSASGTALTSITGVGPVTAALIIGNTGDISRFPSAAHFASYNGTAPLEASSGDRRRHRLNPRGNRQLNYALHVVAVVQLRCGGDGRAYYDRKIADGKPQGSPPGAETPAVQRCVPDPRQRSATGRTGIAAGPGGHPGTTRSPARPTSHPDHRLFGQVTSRTQPERYERHRLSATRRLRSRVRRHA